VIREDDGSGDLGQAFGGSYARVLKGTDPALPEELRLRRRFRLNVERASDEKILDTVARLVAAYVRQLEFETSDSDAFVGSPFDRFLELNALPRVPWKHETPQQYSERLRRAVERIRSPRFVAEGPFLFHDQERRFGALELAGLRVFLADVPEGGVEPGDLARGGVGNCAACHPAPLFTDFRLHNTGVSQLGYDEVHGDGSFLALDVPDLARRNLDPDAWLPATARHPNAREPFRAIPRHGNAGLVDLGAWNVFANPDFPGSQARLRRALCLEAGPRRRCDRERLLARALATFKTPGLRDLSHSAPYMHDGAFDTLEDVIGFYRRASELARSGELRNGAAPIAEIVLAPEDVAPLAAFLRSLNEDYE
jgi:cytochrome c peroxidase